MNRIVVYNMLKGEFDALVKHLIVERTYIAHGYRGMPESTIDDGSSTRFEDCKRFSTFQYLGSGESVTLRVEDSQLAKTVDLYFASQH